MPLLLLQTRLHAIKACRPLYTGTQSISISVLFKLDSKTHDTNSVHTLIPHNDTAEDLATVQVHYDKVYIRGNKAAI